MMVADEVDICAMFEEEVDYAVGGGDDWTPAVVFNADNRLVMWTATAKRSGADAAATAGKHFKTLWFDDNLNGKIKDDGGANRAGTVTGTANAMHDLYNQNLDEGQHRGDLGVPDRRRRRSERRGPRQGGHGDRRGRRGHRR